MSYNWYDSVVVFTTKLWKLYKCRHVTYSGQVLNPTNKKKKYCALLKKTVFCSLCEYRTRAHLHNIQYNIQYKKLDICCNIHICDMVKKKKKIVKLNYIFWRSSLAYIMSYNCYSIVGFRLLLFRLEDLRCNYKSLSHSCSLLSIYPYINSLTHVCPSFLLSIYLWELFQFYFYWCGNNT